MFESLEFNSNIAISLKDIAITEVNRRFADVEQVHLLALSTFLDPRFRNIHFNNPRALAQVHIHLNNLIKENINSSNSLNSNVVETNEPACVIQEGKDNSILNIQTELAKKY